MTTGSSDFMVGAMEISRCSLVKVLVMDEDEDEGDTKDDSAATSDSDDDDECWDFSIC